MRVLIPETATSCWDPEWIDLPWKPHRYRPAGLQDSSLRNLSAWARKEHYHIFLAFYRVLIQGSVFTFRMQQSHWSIIDCRPLWGISVRLRQATVSMFAKNCTVSRLAPGPSAMFSLFLKGVDDLPQACIKTGASKCCQTRRGWKRLLSRVWKGLHLVYLLSWKFWVWLTGLLGSKPDGKVWEKKSRASVGEWAGWKAAALARPQRMQEPSAYCAKEIQGPASVDRAGSQYHCSRWPGLMSTPELAPVVLAKAGPPSISLAHSFIHSFLWTVLKSLLGLGCEVLYWEYRNDQHSLCLLFCKGKRKWKC